MQSWWWIVRHFGVDQNINHVMHGRAHRGRGRLGNIFWYSVGRCHLNTLSLGLFNVLAGDACGRLTVGMRALSFGWWEGVSSSMDFAVLEAVVPQVHWYDPFGLYLLVVVV